MADDGVDAGAAPSNSDFPNYDKEIAACKAFLQNHRTPPTNDDEEPGPYKYMEMLDRVKSREIVRVDINLGDVLLTASRELADAIVTNAERYVDVFSKAIDSLLPAPDATESEDILDVLMRHRIRQVRDAAEADGVEVPNFDPTLWFPPALLRRFEVRFIPGAKHVVKKLRDVKATDLGKLVQIKCIVIRASDIKPMMQVAAYACDDCGWELYQEVRSKTFMPVPKCVSKQCVDNQNIGRINMQSRGSKFIKYQELRVQELPEQVPVGHIPRSMLVIARGETTRETIPGDIVTIAGIFAPTPYTGFQAIKAGLTADTILEAHHITKMKKAIEDVVDENLETAIQALADNDPYGTLARAIAPEIFGMEDVKKALLLQLVGGVTQVQSDGMKTRGDINICLMGDPGVAKSQLLKYMHKLAPRAVYTTGKGSSGVGLTAAVVKDPVTNELALEGGALVLADMGICCIDEFDKMEEADRTAIHEVMEQQTVSIAKAGITTTLNARTAILAAANPKYGRYNRRADADAHVALMKNINLPAALLSRFDLLFLLLDEVDNDNDRALAAHITYVHAYNKPPELDEEPLPEKFVRQYISIAKHINPFVPEALTSFVVEAYVQMRQADKARASATGGRGTLTARQLLSILRMSQALARLELRLEVQQRDVEEAIRLIQVSKASVMETGPAERAQDTDASSRVFAAVRDKCVEKKSSFILVTEAQALLEQAGFQPQQLQEMLDEYCSLNLLTVNASKTRIDFVV